MNKSINRAATILVLALATTLSPNALGASPYKQTPGKGAVQLTQSYVWYDGNREQTLWLNPQIVAEFNPSLTGANVMKSAHPGATVMQLKRNQRGIRVWQLDNNGGTAVNNLAASNPVGKYSPVFHVGPSTSGAMRALPGNIIVYLNPDWSGATVNNWLKTRQLEVVKKLEIGPNIYVIKTAAGLEALNTANTLYQSGEVLAAFPDWWQEVSAR